MGGVHRALKGENPPVRHANVGSDEASSVHRQGRRIAHDRASERTELHQALPNAVHELAVRRPEPLGCARCRSCGADHAAAAVVVD